MIGPVVRAVRDRPEIAGGREHALREQKSGHQLAIGARGSHDHSEWATVQTNLERLLGCGAIEVGRAAAVAYPHDLHSLERFEHLGLPVRQCCHDSHSQRPERPLTLPAAMCDVYNCRMADTSSFDITSTIDFQEVDNALNQARKEVGQRYDFKGAKADIDLSVADKKLTLTTSDEMKMNALWEIVQTRLVRRGVAVKNFKVGDSEAAAGAAVRRVIEIQSGIPTEAAKEIVKFLKEKKLKKVQANIQADQVRVSSPSKDELQEAMKTLRDHDFGIALQFGNYR